MMLRRKNRPTLPDFPFPHATVASLDPLDASGALLHLPQINAHGDVNELTRLLRSLVPSEADLAGWDLLEQLAVMRDIGMLLSSLKRHGVEPVEAVPEVEPVLLRIAAATDLPPRNTMLHYNLWNHRGAALLSHSGTPDEAHIIESGRAISPPLERAVEKLCALRGLPLGSSDYEQLCKSTLVDLREVVDVLANAYPLISPHVFATVLRPYYESIRVGGALYGGPSGVEAPLFIVDHILCTAGSDRPIHRELGERYLPCVLPYLRERYARFNGGPSIVAAALTQLEAARGVSAQARQSALALCELLRCLIRFRAPHLMLAQKAYSSASGNEHSGGSGGYAPSALAELLAFTRDLKRRIEDHVSRSAA